MPKCQGLPNEPCPKNVSGETVRNSVGGLFLCPDCMEIRHPLNSNAQQTLDNKKISMGSSTSDSKMSGSSKTKSKSGLKKKKSTGIADNAITAKKSRDLDVETDNKCGSCSKIVDDDGSIMCEVCDTWFHQKCSGISDSLFEALDEDTDTDSVHWYCQTCNKRVSKLIQEVARMDERQDTLELELIKTKRQLDKVKEDCSKFESSIESLYNRVSDLEKCESSAALEINSMESKMEEKLQIEVAKKMEAIKPTFSEVVSNQLDSKISQVNVDMTKFQKELDRARKEAEDEKERENRGNNIVIFRVKESDSDGIVEDTKFCMELFNIALGVEVQESDLQIKGIVRLGKRVVSTNNIGDKSRPLLVKIKERGIKNKIMENLIKLKNAEEKYRNIGISHDLAPMDREECKRLVSEAKAKQEKEEGEYMWRVRGLPGQLKVVRIKKHAQAATTPKIIAEN